LADVVQSTFTAPETTAMLDFFPFDSVESYALFDDEDDDEDAFMDFFNEDVSASSKSSDGGSE
jgi:hypothetical protein